MQIFLIFWSILILSALAAIIAAIIMKIGVNERLSVEERFSWWSARYDEPWKVARKYKDFYPSSSLPLIGKLSFWVFVALFATWAVATLLWEVTHI